MKELFKKFTSILMVIVTLLDMFLGPICVLASEVDAKAGDLRLGTEYKSEIGESVSATEGSFKSEGDVEIRKTVTKLDNNGKYEVKFEARGKDTSKTTYNEAPIYAVIVFDRSNSMTNKTGKWDNAKSAARAFAEGLIEKYAKANIAVVTFGTTAKTTQEFINSDLKSTSDDTLFGYAPTNRWDENGATNLHAGLEEAKTLLSSDKIKKEKDAKKYVIVISDGAPTKYGVNGDGGNGSNTSYNCIDYPVNTAKTLKESGVEIFTVGYDLSSKIIYEGDWWNPYRNSTAASILTLIATDDQHYVSSDKDNIVDKLKGIVSSTTVYSPAAKNLVIVDNIGKAFSSESDTDKDGKITLTLDKTTGEWQEVGKFEIQIDKNSTTGWHNTNDNFTYTWDGLGETKESTKNPEVYWVQPEYAYTIKHMEKDTENVLATDNGKANYGTSIEVKSKDIKGFTYDSKDKDSILIDEDNNIAYVYYTRNSYGYTIKHVELNNPSNVLKEETNTANYKDIIEVKELSFTGYTFNSKSKNSIVIDEENNIAYVYYVKNNYNYTIKHVEKGNTENVLKTETGSAKFEENIPVNELNFKGFTYDHKDKDSIIISDKENIAYVYYKRNNYNYTIKHVELGNESNILDEETKEASYNSTIEVKSKNFTGYTYVRKSSETIVIDEENNIAYVYYTKNSYNYTIKHMETGTNTVLDTEGGTAKFEETIKVNSKNFTGFTYDYKDKESIIISDKENIAYVYYKRNNYNYTIKHVELGNESNILDVETKEASYDATINVNSKEFTGYTYVRKSSETIKITDGENIAYVYYKRNNYNYIIKHVEENTENVLKTETDTANYEDVINVKESTFKGFTYVRKSSETIEITDGENIAYVYYKRNNYNYTIKHVEENTENVLKTETDSVNYEDVINVNELTFKGFTYVRKSSETIEITDGENIAYVYYKRNNYNYTIKHMEKNTETLLGIEEGTADFEDTIKVNSKIFTGFTYDSKDKDSIIISDEENIAYVYYTRNNYNYTIKHVENGNTENVLKTETNSANYEDVINVKELTFTGFTYDSKDKDSIKISDKENIAYVYYTRNNYNYTIKHVEKDTNKLLAQDTNSANYEEVIAVEPKEFTGFTYDSKDKDSIIINEKENIAYVYYTRNNYEYIIRHIEKNTDNILDIEMDSAKYEDIIKVNEKEFTGFTYDSKDKETIIISTEDNIANIYYTRNSYDYSIVHLEKDTNNVLGIETDTANYEDVINVNEKEFTGFTYDSKSSETITINEDKNIAYVYYTRNTYSYKVEHYVEKVDGTFELRDTDEINDVLYESKITYNVKDYKNYIYDESKTINPEYVLNGNEVVKLYYVLGESEVIVHYVVKVDDNYIPFAKAAYDANGKLISNFEGVTLTDAKFVGKIGSEFKTELRYVYEYAFNGIYEGNILINTNIPKLDGETITSTIDFETKEYTYVYESPKGGDVPVPPDTGINNFSYANYLLLLVIAYLLKKYTTKEN